jgi:hypothetical protein
MQPANQSALRRDVTNPLLLRVGSPVAVWLGLDPAI